jgi:DNA-directed RNA polymerase subunit K/omega
VLRFTTVMDDVNKIAEEGADGPERPSIPAPPIQSRFLFVDVAALRAKQLRRGARPRVRTDEGPLPHKAERLAMEEVRRGLVYYDVPPKKPGEDDPSPSSRSARSSRGEA